jgi:hypothetical protein
VAGIRSGTPIPRDIVTVTPEVTVAGTVAW